MEFDGPGIGELLDADGREAVVRQGGFEFFAEVVACGDGVEGYDAVGEVEFGVSGEGFAAGVFGVDAFAEVPFEELVVDVDTGFEGGNDEKKASTGAQAARDGAEDTVAEFGVGRDEYVHADSEVYFGPNGLAV